MRRIALRLSLIAWIFLVQPAAWAADLHSPEWIEAERREAVDLLHNQKYEAATQDFFAILAANPQAPSATFAVDNLKRIIMESGEFKRAQAQYDDLVASGKLGHYPGYTPPGFQFFDLLKDPGKLEAHLFSMLKLGGVVAAKTSLIGFMFNGAGLTEQAQYFLDKANAIGDEVQKRAYQELRTQLLTRPLHYLFPDYYRQIGFPVFAREQLEIVPFVAQSGTTDPFVDVEKSPTRPAVHFNAVALSQYDNNVSQQSDTTGSAGGDHDFLVNLGAQGNPLPFFTYGADYFLIVHDHSRDALNTYQTASHVPEAWASWWNRRDFEVRARVDYTVSVHDPSDPYLYTRSSGSQIQVSKLWNERYQVDLGYAYRANTDRFDPPPGDNGVRSGSDHDLSLKVAYPGKSHRLQPYFTVNYDRNLALGNDFDTVSVRGEVGTVYLIGKSSVLSVFTDLTQISYPFIASQRQDILKEVHGEAFLPISEHLFSITLNASFADNSSNVFGLSYQRVIVGGGLVLSL